MSKISPGPWIMATSNSFRRILDARGREIIGGTVQQSDGHPDLHFTNGGFEGPDAKAVLAVPVLIEALLSLLPGLQLDLRYASADDDKDALVSRVQTIVKALDAAGLGDS